MEQLYKAAIFDLDGTLLDTSEGVLTSVVYTIKHMGFEMLSEDRLRSFIGPPIQKSFANAYGLEGDILQEIATVFRNHYKDYDLLKAVPYEGIYEVFSTLSEYGIKPAIATYKRQDYATTILKHFGFDKYTDIMCGADHENRLKKSDIIRNAIELSCVKNIRNVVMIGDSDNDAIGASEIGADFVGVTYGFGFKNSKDVNQFSNIGVANIPKELINIIMQR